MVNVIGVRFENAGKLFYFDPGELWPMPGDYAVVETTHGQALGEVVTAVQQINEEILDSPLQKVVRVASEDDIKHKAENQAAEKEAFTLCQKKIAEHKLDMKLVSVEYTFDNTKILFYFTANGRVDFRSLVKDLAGVFRTRIELRQIGVRDEAKMIGGLGPCGRPICCAAFLGDFQPVSIKMAKEQNLSLNPIKISGVCGRLMCCLKYEQDTYEETRRRMPRVGRDVITPDGAGVVADVNVIKETVRVRVQKGDSYEFKDYPASELQRPGAAAQTQGQQPAAVSEAEPADEQSTQAPATTADAASQEGKPARPKAENRQRGGDKRQPRENRDSRDSREARDSRPEAPAPAAPTPVQQEAPKPQARPTGSAWKAALERAKKAASGSEQHAGAVADPQPVTPTAAAEDHEDILLSAAETKDEIL